MNHLEIGQLESWQATMETEWEAWAKMVEASLGHDLDGDQIKDGYSLDYAHDLFCEGMAAEAGYAVLEATKRAKNEGRQISCTMPKSGDIIVFLRTIILHVTHFEFGPEYDYAQVPAADLWREIENRHSAGPIRALFRTARSIAPGWARGRPGFFVRLVYRDGLPWRIEGGNASPFTVCVNPKA